MNFLSLFVLIPVLMTCAMFLHVEREDRADGDDDGGLDAAGLWPLR